jgi:hypothetical protein
MHPAGEAFFGEPSGLSSASPAERGMGTGGHSWLSLAGPPSTASNSDVASATPPVSACQRSPGSARPRSIRVDGLGMDMRRAVDLRAAWQRGRIRPDRCFALATEVIAHDVIDLTPQVGRLEAEPLGQLAFDRHVHLLASSRAARRMPAPPLSATPAGQARPPERAARRVSLSELSGGLARGLDKGPSVGHGDPWPRHRVRRESHARAAPARRVTSARRAPRR